MTTTEYLINETIDDYEDEEEMSICDSCGDIHDADDLIYFDDELLCKDCLDERTSICDNWGNRFWNDNGYRDNDHDLCQMCYDHDYIECSECERLIHNDDSCYHDNDEYNDAPYCSSCFEKHKSKTIHDYYYKPQPIFYRNSDTDLVYGLELEIDDGGECSDNAKELLNIANYYDEHIYCKHDPSLNNGFKIVSHPMNLQYSQTKLKSFQSASWNVENWWIHFFSLAFSKAQNFSIRLSSGE